MHVGLVILPSDRWKEARRQWEWADEAGFTTAWTYDHIRWGGMPDGPWHSAVPVLAAAAGATERIKLGTLVATPNFRHPVTLAREAITLDDLSDGRLELGARAGQRGLRRRRAGPGTLVPGGATASASRSSSRCCARSSRASRRPAPHDGRRTTPPWRRPARRALLTRPLPLAIAAGGARGLRLAVAHGRHWVTIGPTGRGPRTPEAILEAVRRQRAELDAACAAAGRAVSSIGKILLWTPTEPVIDSAEQFEELIAPYTALGFDQFVLHHPAQTGPYGGSIAAFEEIAARHVAG